MPQIIVYACLALALMGGIGIGVAKVKAWGAAEVQAKWDEANTTAREEEVQRSLLAATALSDDRAKARPIIQQRTVHVDREVEKIVYRSICLPDSGLCLANAAIGGKVAAGCKPDGTMPAVKPPG